MFSASSLVAALTLAIAVAANPIVVRNSPISIPIAKRVNFTGAATLLEKDQARARKFILAGGSKDLFSNASILTSIPSTNQLVDYVVNVGVGTPPTTYSLIVDTGSSNTWVGADKPYVETSSSVRTGNSISVTYGSGDFFGTEFTDTVNLGNAFGFDGVDGIIGIGPVGLTLDTLSPNNSSLIPTVTDNLFSQGLISEHLVSVSFQPTNSEQITNGELTFGGTNSSKFTGNITFTPITSTSPASEFWGIDQSIRYGSSATILSTTAGIVDTGTTLVLVASDALQRYQEATGAVPDDNTGLLRLTTAQFNNLQSLFFQVDGVDFELTANAQIWPRNLNTAIGGSPDSVYLIVADLGAPSGQGLDFINGMTFLERFYSVFDTAKQRVGLATTPFTHATTN